MLPHLRLTSPRGVLSAGWRSLGKFSRSILRQWNRTRRSLEPAGQLTDLTSSLAAKLAATASPLPVLRDSFGTLLPQYELRGLDRSAEPVRTLRSDLQREGGQGSREHAISQQVEKNIRYGLTGRGQGENGAGDLSRRGRGRSGLRCPTWCPTRLVREVPHPPVDRR